MCELRIIPPSVQLSVFCTFALRAVLLHNLPPHLHIFVAATKRCDTRTLCHKRLALLHMLPYYVIRVFGGASTRATGRVVNVTTDLSTGHLGGSIDTYFCRYERIGKSHSGERQHEAPCVHTSKPWFVLQKICRS